MTLTDRIHNIHAPLRTSASMQAAAAELARRRDAAERAGARERETVLQYQAGDAGTADVFAAERATADAQALALVARQDLHRARQAYAPKHLDALAPAAAEIDDILKSLTNLTESLRIKAATVARFSLDNGLPTPRVIEHTARLDDVVRRLRNVA